MPRLHADRANPAGSHRHRHQRRIHRPHRHPAPRSARPTAGHQRPAAALPPVPAGPARPPRAHPHRPGRGSAVTLRPRRRAGPETVPAAAARPPRRRHTVGRRAQGHHPAGRPLPIRSQPAGSRTTITQVAEDAHFLAFTSAGDDVSWLPDDQVDALLTAPPTGNVADSLAHAQLTKALTRLPDLQPHLEQSGRAKADLLVTEHRECARQPSGGARRHRATPAAARCSGCLCVSSRRRRPMSGLSSFRSVRTVGTVLTAEALATCRRTAHAGPKRR